MKTLLIYSKVVLEQSQHLMTEESHNLGARSQFLSHWKHYEKTKGGNEFRFLFFHQRFSVFSSYMFQVTIATVRLQLQTLLPLICFSDPSASDVLPSDSHLPQLMKQLSQSELCRQI